MKTIYFGSVTFADGSTGTIQIRHHNEGINNEIPAKPWEPLLPTYLRGTAYREGDVIHAGIEQGEGDARRIDH